MTAAPKFPFQKARYAPQTGAYEQVRRSAEHIELFGKEIWVLGLPGLIASKQAAARPKDLRQIPELRALLALKEKEHSERGESPSN